MLGVNPILCLPTDYPRKDNKPAPNCIADFTTNSEKFIQKFYFCEYSIPERERAIPHIEWLIEQLKPYATSANPKAYQELATLQFIYICLTQLHFHKTCPCRATFRGQSYKLHNYYDHLYQLGLIATFPSNPPDREIILESRDVEISRDPPQKISGEIVRLLYISGGFTELPIQTSIGLTLSPLFEQTSGTLVYQSRSFRPIFRWHTIQAENKLAHRIYIRYSRNLAPPPPFQSQSFLLRDDCKHNTVLGHDVSLDDFDFRGSDFRRIDFSNILSMRNADCRSTLWENCSAPWFNQDGNKTCEGSIFTDSYYRPLTNSEWGPNIALTFPPARNWFICRPQFPPYINNSCFFTMQNSKASGLCLIQ